MTTREFRLTTPPESVANVIARREGKSFLDRPTRSGAQSAAHHLVRAGLIAATTLKLVGERVAAALTPAGRQALSVPGT
jgi:hypothetical protein